MKSLIHGVGLLTALCWALHADTITTRGPDPASVNGSLTKATSDELWIVARYASGEKTFPVKRTAVEIIEFNGTTFNSGAPPKELGIGPPLPTSASGPPPEPADTIVLRGAQRRACRLVGIDERTVHCSGKDGDYPRKIVLRVILSETPQ